MNASVRLLLLVSAVSLLGRVTVGQTAEEVQKAIQALAPGESVTVAGMTFTLRQRLAGTPDTEGWYSARSIGAGFEVRLPVPFSELGSVALTADGVTLTSHTVGGTSTDGARFSANCIGRSDGKMPPGWADGVADSLQARGTVIQRSRLVSPGRAGVEITLASPSVHFHGQLVEANGYMCQLSVEYPSELEPRVGQQARTFLDSFTFP